jgi:hypothetical protein
MEVIPLCSDLAVTRPYDYLLGHVGKHAYWPFLFLPNRDGPMKQLEVGPLGQDLDSGEMMAIESARMLAGILAFASLSLPLMLFPL